MSNKLLLGILEGEAIYMTKHSWDCSWYWSFGYLSNESYHFHLAYYLKENTNIPFTTSKLTQSNWWTVRDLFIQAYSLKAVAKTYKHGGHQSIIPGVTDVLRSKEKEDAANKDLKLLLDTAWTYLEGILA